MPDCEKSFKYGDPSIINHEHVNYFTKKNLFNTMLINKFKNIKTFSDKFGNLYCYNITKTLKKKKLNKNFELLQDYKIKFLRLKKNIEEWSKKVNFNTDYLILYGAISTVSNIFYNLKFNKNKIFIVDSDNSKQKLYLSGIKNSIKKINELKKLKNFKIIILPLNYENQILNYLINDINIKKKMIYRFSKFYK